MGRMNGTRLSLLVGEGRELTSSACLQFSIRELALVLMVLTDAADVKEDGAGETGERDDVSLISSELSDSSSSSAGVGQLLKPRHPLNVTSNDTSLPSIFEYVKDLLNCLYARHTIY